MNNFKFFVLSHFCLLAFSSGIVQAINAQTCSLTGQSGRSFRHSLFGEIGSYARPNMFSAYAITSLTKNKLGNRVRWRADQPGAFWSWGTVVKVKVPKEGDTICAVLFDSFGPDEKNMPALMNAKQLTSEPLEDIRSLTQVVKCKNEFEQIVKFGEEKKCGLFKSAVNRLVLRLKIMNTRLEEQLNPGVHQLIDDYKVKLEDAKRKYGL